MTVQTCNPGLASLMPVAERRRPAGGAVEAEGVEIIGKPAGATEAGDEDQLFAWHAQAGKDFFELCENGKIAAAGTPRTSRSEEKSLGVSRGSSAVAMRNPCLRSSVEPGGASPIIARPTLRWPPIVFGDSQALGAVPSSSADAGARDWNRRGRAGDRSSKRRCADDADHAPVQRVIDDRQRDQIVFHEQFHRPVQPIVRVQRRQMVASDRPPQSSPVGSAIATRDELPQG